ncbi:MAG TPA: RNA polymerase sigma factor [Symbiobacteriaceae bacterium]|nr:RNA polymerase sigma factor [Symbiobacteriaceae bacterium]
MGQLSSWTDQALLQSALEGQQEAWGELVNRYHDMGFGYVQRHINDPYLAQDILQNLWATLIVTVRRQQPDSFAALFWTLLKRRMIDELRKKGRTKEAATLDAPVAGDEPEGATQLDRVSSSAPGPEDEAVRSDSHRLLYEAMDRLPDHYRMTLLSRMQGRSNRETAQLLVKEQLVPDDGNVEKKVENYYYRGLQELKRQLKALGYDGGGGAA